MVSVLPGSFVSVVVVTPSPVQNVVTTTVGLAVSNISTVSVPPGALVCVVVDGKLPVQNFVVVTVGFSVSNT